MAHLCSSSEGYAQQRGLEGALWRWEADIGAICCRCLGMQRLKTALMLAQQLYRHFRPVAQPTQNRQAHIQGCLGSC